MILRGRWGWASSVVLICGSLNAEMVTRRWGTPPADLTGKSAPAPAARLPTCCVVRTPTAPKLDGTLDDEAWKKARPCSLARTLDGSGPAPQPTEALLLRDDKTLYLGFRCAEDRMDNLRSSVRGHDGAVWEDDSIEVFIGAGGAYYHFGAGVAGGTYDAKGKDASWNCGFQAAVARGTKAWTVELAIPLAKLAEQGKVPEEWTANFNRNRRVTGALEESAWSPTYGGDSHVPARFGKMLLRDSPPTQPAENPSEGERPAGKKSAVEVLAVEGGLGVVRFDLSDLQAGTKVYRADLLIFRTAQATGATREALEEIEIYPLSARFKPAVSGAPLALRAPWYDRFDATEAVRKWVANKSGAEFFVKACPFWIPEGACLEVAYEALGAPAGGTPEPLPPVVKDVKAFHRAGQTFITWKEPDPLIATPQTTWGEIKKKLAEAKDACRYRIYAHDKPITAGNIHEAELLAEVGPLSAYNVNARNKEYLIGQAMVRSDEMGELAREYGGYMHTWHMDSPRMDRYPVERFVIDEEAGPLPVGTGLYVHHPAAAGRRHYAVVSVRDGVENTREVPCTDAVQEAVGLGEPVRQGKGLWGPFFDYPGTRWVYVQWCAPPLSPRPNMAFNWSVLIPPGVEANAPAELYFHPEGYSYAQPGKKMLLNSIQIAPHDYPSSGWYGFNDAWGTLKSFQAGAVRNHTQRRIMAFLEWAKRKLPIDADRVLPVGSDGAAALALSFPDAFAYVLITGFDRQGVLEPKAAPRFAAAWGPSSPQIKDEKGRGDWAWANLDELVSPDRDLPLLVCCGPSWGADKGWGKGRGRFYSAVQKANQPLIAHWAWGGTLPRPDKYTGLWRGLDIRRDTPVPAFTNCSLDVEGEGSGNANAGFSWKDLKETPDGFDLTVLSRACTFDLSPRRCREFKVKPGEQFQWQATPLPSRGGKKVEPQAQAGRVAADGQGIVTVKGLTVPQDCPGVNVKIARTK